MDLTMVIYRQWVITFCGKSHVSSQTLPGSTSVVSTLSISILSSCRFQAILDSNLSLLLNCSTNFICDLEEIDTSTRNNDHCSWIISIFSRFNRFSKSHVPITVICNSDIVLLKLRLNFDILFTSLGGLSYISHRGYAVPFLTQSGFCLPLDSDICNSRWKSFNRLLFMRKQIKLF